MRVRCRRLALALSLALVGVVPAFTHTAAAALTVPPVAFLDSEPGDTIGGGTTHKWEGAAPPADLLTATGMASTVTFTCSAQCQPPLTVSLGTPTGGTWAVQKYEDATRTADATHPQLDVQYNGTSCTTVKGRFIVDEVTMTGPAVTAFSARFEQHCNGDAAALFGSVSFGANNYYKRSVSPTALDFGDYTVTKTKPLDFTVTNDGPSSITPGSWLVSGANAADFTVIPPSASSPCTNLTTHQACLVHVNFTPTTTGTRTAVLTFTDELSPAKVNGTAAGTGGDGRHIVLTGNGIPPPPTKLLTVTGEGAFGTGRAGILHGQKDPITVKNTGQGPVTITDISIGGQDPDAFAAETNCLDFASNGTPVAKGLGPGATCLIHPFAYPTKMALQKATVVISSNADNGTQSATLRSLGTDGYYLAHANGAVSPRGDAVPLGDMAGRSLNAPIVNIATTATGDGYWLLGGDGGIFSFGDAAFHGSMGGTHLNAPINGIATTRGDNGYWQVAYDGGIFAFGDATFYGSMGGQHLNKPVVGMARTPSGQGYWLVASDGGIFAYGDAPFLGSTGAIRLNKPIVAMAPTASGRGYWLVASDGGIFAYGDAPFLGSASGLAGDTIVGMAATPTGQGYYVASATGHVYHFGDAVDYTEPLTSSAPAVGMAETAPPVDHTFTSSFH